MAAETLAGRLRSHAQRRPNDVAIVAWAHRDRPSTSMTFEELNASVKRLVDTLRTRLSAGHRILIALPNDESFPVAFLASQDAGCIPVPAPIPTAVRAVAFRERLRNIAEDCEPSLVLTAPEWVEQIERLLGGRVPVCAWNGGIGPVLSGGILTSAPRVRSGRIAFIQYTSGSTKRPRGVEVTHRMLTANLAQVAELYGENESDTAVTWVPLYHDMGLVTGLARPLHHGYRTVLLRPDAFAADPMIWLEAMSEESGTLSSSPNFGYDLCVRKLDQARRDRLDLSSWRIARNAGEVVHHSTADAFADAFAVAGFKTSAFCPSYGMAEATLTVTTCTPDEPPLRLPVSRDSPDRGRMDQRSVQRTTILLSSGTPVPGTEIRIEGAADDVIGPILIRGPQTFEYYWSGNAEPHLAPVTDGWMRTGDIGTIWGGHLFVLGREDDVLIAFGQKFYIGSDILPSCAGVAGIRPGRIGLFTFRSGDNDEVHLVAELRDGTSSTATALRELRRQVQRVVAETCGLFLTKVHFASAGSLPVTTSGKVRHLTIRDRYVNGDLKLID